MTQELKPCPFCGGEALAMRDEDDCPYVCCAACDVSLPAYRPGFEAKAAAAWNRRAANFASEAELEKTREAALEEAAQLCDAQADEPECPERASYCADAIRAAARFPRTASTDAASRGGAQGRMTQDIEPPRYSYGKDGKGPVTFLNPMSPREFADRWPQAWAQLTTKPENI